MSVRGMTATTSARGDAPIGVFDSGVGGLTVAAALMRRLPTEPILYLGDTARLPYGTKSPTTVTRYTERTMRFLVGRGVKAAVVACNTASALALPTIEPPVPTWGVIEPGAAAAAAASRGRCGVVATESTVRSGAYARAIERLRPDLEVVSQACGLFVSLAEEGWSTDPLIEPIVRRYMEPLRAADLDTLVLGCTHYPLLAPTIAKVMGPQVTLIDSADAVAETVANALAEQGLLREATNEPPRHHLCVTDTSARFRRIASDFLEQPATLELVDV